MTGRSPSRRWKDLAAPAASLVTLAGLGLAVACTTTGAAKPAASVPPPAPKTQVAAASAPAPAGVKPALEVVGGEAFSFGAFWVGEPLKHTFVLKNTGATELKILRVQPG